MNKKLLFTILTTAIFSFSQKKILATVHTIQVGAGSGFSFVPATGVTAVVGDTIKFVWVSGTHTTTSTTIPAGAAHWDNPINSAATTFLYVPTVAGTYNYQCNFHYPMGMIGSFVVSPPVVTFHTIQVGTGGGFSFSPLVVNAILGDTIKFIWVGGNHTATSEAIPAGATSWNVPINSGATSFMYIPAVTGTYNYQCNFHVGMGMIGSFIVSAPALPPATHVVQVGADGGFSFSPSSITNAIVGDTIDFVWVQGNHTATSVGVPTGATAWDMPINSGATSFEYVPTVTGTYNYQCNFHYPMGMVGSFVVGDTIPAVIWTGNDGTDWTDPNNWSTGVVPAPTDFVNIPADAPNMPEISTTGDYTIRTITVPAGASLILDDGVKLGVTGNVSNNGTISGDGCFLLKGTTLQTITGNGFINNLKLKNNAGATIKNNSSVSITGAYTNENGTLTTNNRLTLVSNSSGTALINPIISGNISGNVNVQQYIPGERSFRFLSHPFSSAIALSQLTSTIDITGSGGSTHGFTTTVTNNPSAFWYNPVTGNGSAVNDNTGWIPFTSTNGSGTNAWNPAEGIRLLVRGPQGEGLNGNPYNPDAVTLAMSGAVNQGNVNIPFTIGANSGYNLLGNPYPSPVDIGTPIYNASQAGAINGSAYWLWDATQQPEGAYITIPMDGSVYPIPGNAAFMINAATNSSLAFTEANKTGTGSATPLFKTVANNKYVILNLYGNGKLWDVLYLSFNQNAAANMEGNDAAKLHNSTLDFYSLSTDNKELSIDARPYEDGQIIPLGIQTSVLQGYVIKAGSFNVPSGEQLMLHDKYLNVYQQLEQGAQYTFTVTADTASQGNNRFEISTFSDATTGVAPINGNNGLAVQISPNPTTGKTEISYSGAQKGDVTINVVDITGKVVYTTKGTGQSGAVVMPLQSLAAGAYIIVTQSGNQKIIRKLIKE